LGSGDVIPWVHSARFSLGYSRRPILSLQAWNSQKVAKVSREERGVVREGDGRNFHIHRSDANPKPTKPLLLCGGTVIESKNNNGLIVFEVSPQSGVSGHLLGNVLRASMVGQPSAGLFFVGND
jgi:hypothetical protein